MAPLTKQRLLYNQQWLVRRAVRVVAIEATLAYGRMLE
jgi:hypothetical protein